MNLDYLESVARKATPGPRRWEVNEKDKDIQLVGGTPKYDCTIMDFCRYGMNGAMPRFVTEPKPYMNLLAKATTVFAFLLMVAFCIFCAIIDAYSPGCFGCLFILLPLLNTFVAYPIVLMVYWINR